MKKTLITTVCTLALASAAFAQGNVSWSTISAAAITAQTNSTTYSPFFGGGSAVGGSIGALSASAQASAGTGFYFELLDRGGYNGSLVGAAPTSLAALSTWSDAGLTATNNTTTAGRLVAVNPNVGSQVSWSPGTTNYIILVGWSANLGTSWSAAQTALNTPATLAALTTPAYFGISAVGAITTLSTLTSPGANVFGAATAQGTPINGSLNTQLYLVPVTPVPEPGTMALAALGGASLLLFRRRNK